MSPDTEIVDFDQWEAGQAESTPSWAFKLDGREWHTRQPEDVPFDIIEQVIAPGGRPVGTDQFFTAVLMPDEVDDFLAMKRRPDSPLTLRNAEHIIRTISEQVVARPTNRQQRRAAGSRGTGRGGRAGSSSAATRPVPSAG